MKKLFLISFLVLNSAFLFSQVQLTSTSGATPGVNYNLQFPGNFTLSTGVQITFKAHTANIGPCDLNISGSGAHVIVKQVSTALAAGDILTNQEITVVYDGTNFQITSATGNLASASAWGLTGNAGTDGGTTNFIGTTDNVPFNIRVNNEKSGKIDAVSLTFFGYQAGRNNTGTGSTGFGHRALIANTTGNSNTAVGYQALNANTTGGLNTAMGLNTMFNNVAGIQNSAFGAGALGGNTYAGWNVAIGYNALNSQNYANGNAVYNTHNVAVGAQALLSNQPTSNLNGRFNTAMGSSSLLNNTTGSQNTAFGYQALQTNTTGTNNIAIGYLADVSGGALTNATAIGANAVVSANDRVKLGNNADIQFDRALMPAGLAGTAGQVLTSAGAGVAPTWAAVSGTLSGGTTNYLPKWTSANALSSTSLVYDNGTNVGIGTASPTNGKLDVQTSGATPAISSITTGTSNAGYFQINNAGNASTALYTTHNGSGYSFLSTNTGSGYAGYFQINNSANTLNALAATTNGPGAALNGSNTHSGANAIRDGIYVTTSGAGGVGTTNRAGYFSATGAASNYSAIFEQGSVGIGTTTPNFLLDVNGIIRSGTPGTSGALKLYSEQGATDYTVTFNPSAAMTENTIYTLPTAKATALNSALVSTTTGVLSWAAPGAAGAGLPVGTSGQTLRHDGSNWVANSNLYNNGTNVGMGAVPVNKLDVNGSVAIGPSYAGSSVANAGGLIVEGAIGIGTPTVSSKLNVYGSNDPLVVLDGPANSQVPLVFATAGVNKWAWFLPSGGADLSLWHYGTPAQYYLKFDGTTGNISLAPTSGNVGIGLNAVAPLNKLDVEGGVAIGSSYSGTNTSPANGLIVEGNMGIGTPSPSYKMHTLLGGGYVAVETSISGSNPYGMRFISPDRNWYFLLSGGGTTAGSFGIYDGTASAYRMYIDPTTGNTGFGTTTTPERLNLNGRLYGNAGIHIGGTNGNQGLVTIQNDGGTTWSDIFECYNSSLTQAFVVKNTGFVGINDPSPAYNLDVTSSSTSYAGRFKNTGTAGADGLNIDVTTTATGAGTRYGLYSTVWYGQGSNYGVYTYGYGGTTAYGIFATAAGASSANYAGYFSGNVNITGSISKGSGTFKIDHPLDPENKVLYHSFVESPDMMNVYNGNVTTDVSGIAEVELPDYFEALNKDFRYQLTVIGDFAQVIVAEKVKGNKFKIKTDKPNIEVSWQVTGIRKDPFAEKNRVVPEVNKTPEEKGKYLYPEAYGKPEEMGIDYSVKKEQIEKQKAHELELKQKQEGKEVKEIKVKDISVPGKVDPTVIQNN
jgi:hypothetical protein